MSNATRPSNWLLRKNDVVPKLRCECHAESGISGTLLIQANITEAPGTRQQIGKGEHVGAFFRGLNGRYPSG